MNFPKLNDRIKEKSYTSGLGDLSLDGAMTGFSSFSSVYSSGEFLYYAVSDGTNYEIGSGIYNYDGLNYSLKRFPFRSTNGDNLVNFGAGLKEVYVTYPGKYSVFTASGVDNFKQPQSSGIAFWESQHILNYSDGIIWDDQNNYLGINQSSPKYSIHVGGDVENSLIASSGFIVGDSGVLFNGENPSYSGGLQREPFYRNQLDNTSGSDAIFELSGIVSESLLLKKQSPMTVFAGPSGDCGCIEDYPTFRVLSVDDIPGVSGWIVSENQATSGWVSYELNEISGVDGLVYSVSGWASGYVDSQLAGGLGFTYWELQDGDGNSTNVNHSNVVYISGISGISTFLNSTDKNLYVDGSELSGVLRGYVDTVSGYLETSPLTSASTLTVDHIEFGPSDREISIGYKTNEFNGVSGIIIGYEAGVSGSSSDFASLIGYQSGSGLKNSNYSIGLGYKSLISSSGQQNTVSIGKNAGYQSSGNLGGNCFIGGNAGYQSDYNRSVLIGESAGYKSSGEAENVCIGYFAGNLVDNGSGLINIGSFSASQASNVTRTISIGKSSFSSSDNSSYCIGIGDNSLAFVEDATNSISIGNQSSFGARGVENICLIGNRAGYNIKNSSGCVDIGYYAGYVASGCINDINIGYEAGYSASGSDNSINIGYQAGKYRSTGNSISIKSNNKNHDFTNIDSTNKNQKYLISINDIITGRMGVNGNHTNIRIGASGNISEYIDYTVSIKPESSSDAALHLLKSSSSHSSPLLSVDSNDGDNTIVNKNGYLKIPLYSDFVTATGSIGLASDNPGVMFYDQDDDRMWVSNGTNWKGFNSDITI